MPIDQHQSCDGSKIDMMSGRKEFLYKWLLRHFTRNDKDCKQLTSLLKISGKNRFVLELKRILIVETTNYLCDLYALLSKFYRNNTHVM